jgi:integrase
MVRRNLTDRKVKSLKRNLSLEDKFGHYDTWDMEVRGLGVRVSKTGRRTFVLMARYPGGSAPTRRALGTYGELTLEEAREKARGWKKLIEKGIDPVVSEVGARPAPVRLQANTFTAVAEDYLRLQVIGPDADRPRQRKAADVARDFRGIFTVLWGGRPITSISRHDVLALIEGVRDNGTAAILAADRKGKNVDQRPAPGQARNLLGQLKTFFGWAIEQGAYGLESSPCEFVKGARVIGERPSNDRTLDDAEIFAFWRAASRMPYPFGPLYRLLLLSGLRLNEVADAVWNEIDLARGMWTIPAVRMKGKNGKARPHSVPLTAGILAVLSGLPRFNRGEHLFSTTSGESPVWVSDKVKRRLDAAMLVELRELARKRGENPAEVNLPAWVNHDLRRTLRSRLSELRVSAGVVEAILAHASPGIRNVNDRHEYFDEKRDALELWAHQLETIALSKAKAVAVRAVPLVESQAEGPRATFAERLGLSRRA